MTSCLLPPITNRTCEKISSWVKDSAGRNGRRRSVISNLHVTAVTHVHVWWNDHSRYNGVEIVGVSNHKVKSVLKCTVWSQCRFLRNRRYWRTGETAIQCHSRSSVIVPIDAAHTTSYQHSIVTQSLSSTALEISRVVCTFMPPFHTPPVFRVELEKGGWELVHALVSG